MGMSPSVKQVDNTNPIVKPLQGQQADFLQGIFRGNNPFQGQTSPLQQQAVGQMGQFLNQAAPEQKALTASQSALGAQLGMNPQMFGQNSFQQQTTGAGPQALQFAPVQLPNLAGLMAQAANPFQQLQNPFAQMGAVNPGQQVVQAAQPVFQQNLQAAQTQLGQSAPGRFSSAFVSQGQDLASKALSDFNLFQAQQLQAGQALQNQQQQQALQFMLGARQLQQGAQSDAIGAQTQLAGLQQQGALGAQQLAQQGALQSQDLQLQNLSRQDQFNLAARQNQQAAQQAAMQNQLAMMAQQQGAAGVLGQLAGQAGQNPFERLLGAGQLGGQLTQNAINPLLQLMMGGLQYAQPQNLDAIVGKSPFEQFSGLATGLGSLAMGGAGMGLHLFGGSKAKSS